MRLTGAAKVAGVVGWPVAHSLSPLIHNAWIEALGLDAAYVPFAVPPERFEAFVEGLRGGTVQGLNVTAPHKVPACRIADGRSVPAAAARAANVLAFNGAQVLADNTDGIGMLGGILEVCPDFRCDAGPAVVIGAGGAAGSVASHLQACGARDIRIVARRVAAAGLRLDPGLNIYAWDDLPAALNGAQLVVNATPLGLGGVGEPPPSHAAPREAVFMDMVYAPLRTAFLRAAAARGHPTVDGARMLVGQARPSFKRFFGVAPPPPEVVDVRALCLAALGDSGAEDAA